jgi:hypothetical protein
MAKTVSDIKGTTNAIKHWHLNDDEHNHFIVGLEPASRHAAKNCAFIKSVAEDTSTKETKNAFGHLKQMCGIDPDFRGKRIRMTAWVKSALRGNSIGRLELDVIGSWGWYCKWNGTFDNMAKRPIVGETDWQQYSLVVDVPEESVSMNFGLLLIGAGKVWLDEINFEIVDKSIPLTGLPEKAQNFNFTD